MEVVLLNFCDYLLVNGQFYCDVVLLLVLVFDGVGMVLEVGFGVSCFCFGDWVIMFYKVCWIVGVMCLEWEGVDFGGFGFGVMCELVCYDVYVLVWVLLYFSLL